MGADFGVMIDSEILTQPCSVVGYRGGVLHLRYTDCEVRGRFWPEPLLEARQTVDGAWEDAECGCALLQRAGFELGCQIGVGSSRRVRTFCHKPKLAGEEESICSPGWPVKDSESTRIAERALQLLSASIPESVCRCLECLVGSPWDLLQLASRSRGVRNLMQSNPALLCLWVLSVEGVFSALDEVCLQQMRLPQCRQLAALGYIGERRWAKLLRKLPPEELGHLSSGLLRSIMLALMEDGHPQVMRYLQHRSELTAYELMLAACEPLMGRLRRVTNRRSGHAAVAKLFLLGLRAQPRDPNLKLPRRMRTMLQELECMAAGGLWSN